MRAHSVVTVLLLLVGRGLPAAAQELSAETLQAINSASRARARLGDAEWHRLADTGRGMSADGARVYVQDGATTSSLTEVALPEVRELQVARGSNAGKGAFIGGAIGLGLSLVAVIALSGDDWAAPSSGQAVAGMLVNTAAGAGVGALIGSASTHWRTVYQADAP
ncbi:MAG: hypothetical protein ACJ8DJ_13965 [Gemmatimonadales bacterium]|jgi:hypothetical protein